LTVKTIIYWWVSEYMPYTKDDYSDRTKETVMLRDEKTVRKRLFSRKSARI
jgi:hypothetical protein